MSTTEERRKVSVAEGDEAALEKIWAKLLTCATCKKRYARFATTWGCRTPHHSRLSGDLLLTERMLALIPADGTKKSTRTCRKTGEVTEVSGRERQMKRLLRKLKTECGAIQPQFAKKSLVEKFYDRIATKSDCLYVLQIDKWYVAYGAYASRLSAILRTPVESVEVSWRAEVVKFCHSGFDYDGIVREKLLALDVVII